MKSLLAILCCFFSIIGLNAQSSTWKAPPSANSKTSPFNPTKSTLSEGKSLFQTYCAICHGNAGKGDGVAGAALDPKPGNFTKPAFKQQSDGVIYWKIATGNPPMAAYKGVLQEDEIWKIIHYIKTL